jgi:hypothetical protein
MGEYPKASTRAPDTIPEPDAASIDHFLHRISPADPEALLELPIEQLTAQIHAAADLRLATESDIDSFLTAVAGEPMSKVAVEKLSPAALPNASQTPEGNVEMEWRNSMSYTIQRRLDALQIDVRQRWRRYLRLLCMLVSAAIASILAAVFGLWENLASTVLVVILLSALGGFFSSVARDAIAVLERLRT